MKSVAQKTIIKNKIIVKNRLYYFLIKIQSEETEKDAIEKLRFHTNVNEDSKFFQTLAKLTRTISSNPLLLHCAKDTSDIEHV